MFGFMQGWRDGDVRPIMSWLIESDFGFLLHWVWVSFLIQIWYVFHARWPVIIRRQCEHFISVSIFLRFFHYSPFLCDNQALLWKWMNVYNELPDMALSANPIYNWKSPYLNLSF